MFQSLGNYLGKRVGSYSFSKELRAQEVLDMFDKAVIEVIGGDIGAKAVLFKDRVLVVKTPNSSVVQELKLREEDIKKKLARFRISRITYKI